MNRGDLIRHLRGHACEILRQGKRHEIWIHTETRETSPVPRHKSIDRLTVRKICRELGIPNPPGV